jgi:hypothetical protein
MDKKEIISIAKDQGLDLAEDTAAAAVKTAINLLRVIVPKLSTGAGFMVNSFLDIYEKKIFELVDKIDGKVDA